MSDDSRGQTFSPVVCVVLRDYGISFVSVLIFYILVGFETGREDAGYGHRALCYNI